MNEEGICPVCRRAWDEKFMICCDGCHAWYHGTCVGQFKNRKKEWICGRCGGPWYGTWQTKMKKSKNAASLVNPSIVEPSLSVPIVQSLSTSAPCQPCSSNAAQQGKSGASSDSLQSETPTSCLPAQQGNLFRQYNKKRKLSLAKNSGASSDSLQSETPSSSCLPQQGAPTLPNKIHGKMMVESTPESRPRANSIVTPVKPSLANVMDSAGVTYVPLKAVLQTGEHGITKSSGSVGLEMKALAAPSKLVSKAAGPSAMYVVNTTSTTSASVSIAARTVSAGSGVMTLAGDVPKVAVSTGQSGVGLSMTPKPVQALQLAQASSIMNTGGSIPLTSASCKFNEIVVQKGPTAFGQGFSPPHGNKDVVGDDILGGALTTLNQDQTTNSIQVQAASNSNLPSPQSQTMDWTLPSDSTSPASQSQQVLTHVPHRIKKSSKLSLKKKN